jgi:hypothetical protein
MINSSFTTSSKNRMRIDRSAHQINLIDLSSHKSSFNSTIIDSFVDVWMLVANLYTCEQSRVFKFNSSTRDVSLKLIIFDESFSDFWDKSNWIDQLTLIWKCSDFSKRRFLFIFTHLIFIIFLQNREITFLVDRQINWIDRIDFNREKDKKSNSIDSIDSILIKFTYRSTWSRLIIVLTIMIYSSQSSSFFRITFVFCDAAELMIKDIFDIVLIRRWMRQQRNNEAKDKKWDNDSINQ